MNYRNSIFGLCITTIFLLGASNVDAQFINKKHKKTLEDKVFEKTGEYHSLELPKDLNNPTLTYHKEIKYYDSTFKIQMLMITPSDSMEQYMTIQRKLEYLVPVYETFSNHTIDLYNSIPNKEKDCKFKTFYKFDDINVEFSQGYNRGKFNYSINGIKKSIDLDKDLTLLIFKEQKGTYNVLKYVLFDGSNITRSMPDLEITDTDIVLDYRRNRKSLQSIGKITKDTFNEF